MGRFINSAKREVLDVRVKTLIKLFLLSTFFLNATVSAKPLILDIKTQLKFDGTILQGKMTHAQIKKLTLAKIDGGGQFPKGFKGSLDKHVIHNCQEYWRYGLHPNNTYEISMTSFLLEIAGFYRLYCKLSSLKKIICRVFIYRILNIYQRGYCQR